MPELERALTEERAADVMPDLAPGYEWYRELAGENEDPAGGVP